MSVKPIISAAEAAKFVQDGMTFTTSGFVACEMPESLSKALEKSFLETGHPRDLTLFYAAAQGNRDGSGADHFAHEGMLKRVIGGHYNMVPELGKLIFDNKLEAYNLPQGTLSELLRDIAAHKVGTITHVGMNTFCDPRLQGGKLNDVTKEDIVELVNIAGEERLLYKSIHLDVGYIRGTFADEHGNVTLERAKQLPSHRQFITAAVRSLFRLRRSLLQATWIPVLSRSPASMSMRSLLQSLKKISPSARALPDTIPA